MKYNDYACKEMSSKTTGTTYTIVIDFGITVSVKFTFDIAFKRHDVEVCMRDKNYQQLQ